MGTLKKVHRQLLTEGTNLSQLKRPQAFSSAVEKDRLLIGCNIVPFLKGWFLWTSQDAGRAEKMLDGVHACDLLFPSLLG